MFLLQSSLIPSFFRFCQFDAIVTNSYSLAQDFCGNIYIFSAYYLPSKYPTIRYLDLYANYSHAVTILLLLTVTPCSGILLSPIISFIMQKR